ncbi:hypothetical protein [Pelagibacterium mangrovi]|uniref:hypothetical protein n=1 Tax=Pelagibacterium mangrovi TaxID=3119828 RepID=UPI002FCA94D8
MTRKRTKPDTTRALASGLDDLADAIKGYIDRGFAAVEERLAAIEASGIKYSGTWQRAAEYSRGTVVTDGGSSWVALRASTGERPGTVPEAWQLMVKAGKDGRDLVTKEMKNDQN